MIFNWLSVDANNAFIDNLQKKYTFGRMADAFAHQTGLWVATVNNDYYSSVQGLSSGALSLENFIGQFLVNTAPAYQFMSSALSVAGTIQDAYTIYKLGLVASNGSGPNAMLLDYQNLRSTSPNDQIPAQDDIKSVYIPTATIILCVKNSGLCSGNEPTPAGWAVLFSSLEEAYQAIRLVGTSADSVQLRTALGKAIAQAINPQ